jgi:hypothetical protein
MIDDEGEKKDEDGGNDKGFVSFAAEKAGEKR